MAGSTPTSAAAADARAADSRAPFEILFEGQRTATGVDGDVTLATLEDWLLRAREVGGAGELFDRLRGHARVNGTEPLGLNRDEARVLVAVFERSGYEQLRTLLARARLT
jgi:hypothetical protein